MHNAWHACACLTSSHHLLDVPPSSGDVTTLATIPRSQQCHARFLAKSNGVVSGLKIIEYVFAAVS